MPLCALGAHVSAGEVLSAVAALALVPEHLHTGHLRHCPAPSQRLKLSLKDAKSRAQRVSSGTSCPLELRTLCLRDPQMAGRGEASLRGKLEARDLPWATFLLPSILFFGESNDFRGENPM